MHAREWRRDGETGASVPSCHLDSSSPFAAAAAAVVVYKGWAKPIARSVAMWVRGDTDASAYIRNRDSARGSSTAPVQAAGSWQHPLCGVPCKEALPRMTEVKEALAVGTARTAL